MSRADTVKVYAAVNRASDTLYMGVDYSAYCVGIGKEERKALAAQLSALVGTMVRWKDVERILSEKDKADAGGN